MQDFSVRMMLGMLMPDKNSVNPMNCSASMPKLAVGRIARCHCQHLENKHRDRCENQCSDSFYDVHHSAPLTPTQNSLGTGTGTAIK